MAHKTMQQYTESDLKKIGKQCGNRLPPASAVQAMFLYEMQRETELETLFQGQMFRLAKAEDQSTSIESSIRELDAQVKDLWKKVKAKDVNERLAASKVRTDALQGKINHHSQRLDSQDERFVRLEDSMAALSAAKVSNEVAVGHPEDAAANSEQLQVFLSQVDSLAANISAIDHDVQVLFEERDGLLNLLEKAKERIDKLEGTVRALTSQASSHASNPSSTSGSPPSTQLLPVKTKSGDTVDLSVPKGKPLVPHKRDQVLSFTPGKPWMA